MKPNGQWNNGNKNFLLHLYQKANDSQKNNFLEEILEPLFSMALNTEYNELTIQCLKAAKGKRRPMIELFVDENTPQEIWDAAFDVMRSCGGQPAFYNPKVLLGGLKEKLNIADDDIKGFCGGGCTESMIAGMSNVGSLDAGINLLLIFENVMYNYLPKATCFEDFYDKYIDEVQRVAENIMQKISLSQEERAKFNPLPMRSFLIDDCIVFITCL